MIFIKNSLAIKKLNTKVLKTKIKRNSNGSGRTSGGLVYGAAVAV